MKKIATEAAVFAAADALVAEGLEPGMTNVQERTGGSYTTVKRHLEAWMTKRKNDLEAVEVPAEIEAQGREFVKALFAHASRAAQATVAGPLAAAEDARNQAVAKLAAAESEVVRLEGVEQEQAGQIEVLTQQVHELELQSAAQQATVQEKTAAVGWLESQLAEMQNALVLRDQELAELRASAKVSDGLQGQMQALEKMIQALAPGDAAEKAG